MNKCSLANLQHVLPTSLRSGSGPSESLDRHSPSGGGWRLGRSPPPLPPSDSIPGTRSLDGPREPCVSLKYLPLVSLAETNEQRFTFDSQTAERASPAGLSWPRCRGGVGGSGKAWSQCFLSWLVLRVACSPVEVTTLKKGFGPSCHELAPGSGGATSPFGLCAVRPDREMEGEGAGPIPP